jgi:gliding motility-associated-like protein
MRKFYPLLILSVALLTAADSYAQDYSNKGKDFWVIYTGHIDGTTSRMALYITSDQNATGTVSVAGNTINFTVTANQVTTVRFTNATVPSNSVAYNSQIVGIGTNKGIHIVSDHPVVVYSHILNSARSGSTLVLPTNVLGREYYVSSYKSNTSNQATRRSEFAVVAAEDNTTVEIKATAADGNNTYPANIPFQISLNKGDVFQYQSANDGDLTGTYVKSVASASSPCKPIAVFGGSTWTAMGCAAASSGDNLYQELFPAVSWGQLYITAPFISRSYDIFRILVRDPTTVVQVNGVTINPATLILNTYYEFNTSGNNTSRIIASDKPICVVQYMITQNCDGVNSDPEMVILNSVEQTIKDITVLSARNDLTPPATNITSHYLNIIVPTIALSSLRIDGNPYTATPVAIPTTVYSYIQENITASTNVNPTHRVICDSGFLAIAYGYGNVESYGYNAGTNVKDLYQFITIHNQHGTVNFPATCKGTPFYFSMTFPYQPSQITWQFNGLFPDTTIGPSPPPLYDSTWTVNGKTLYRYKLPSPYVINASGTYPIKVVAQNPTPDGCGNEQQIDFDVQVFDPPVADFTSTTNGCVTAPVSFFDNSNTGGRAVISRYWNFGDGNTTGINNPTHSYGAPGAYNVKYSLITDVGCLADTALHVVAIDDPPVASFNASSPNCANRVITFNDLSTVSGGAVIVKWYWDFGDGSPIVIATTNASQTHTYAATGSYNVTLKVETTTGCQSQVCTLAVTIHPNPVADFSFPNICLPVGFAQFTDLSTVSGGSQITGWLWDFGDGSPTSVLQNPTHNYSGIGPYTVTLTVTSNNGCTDVTTHIVNTIYAEPQAAFTYPAEVCLGDAANFIDNSAAPGSTVTQWAWNFGDGSPISSVQSPSHTYAAAGTYTVTLNITSAAGCQAVNNIAMHTIIVNPLPTANFNYTAPTCETKVLNFTDASVANAGVLNSWAWNFGDGSPNSNLQNPTHTYAGAGTYNVTLQVTSTKGCISAVLSRQVIVSPQPLPGFISPEVCLSDAFAQFTDTTRVASGAVVSWLWNFGDPASGPLNTSTLQNPQHRYNAIGSYTATLTVTTNNGCISTIVQSFTVNGDIPVANFNAQNPATLCANDSVAIQDASSVNFGSITKVEIYWDNVGAPVVFQTDDFPAPGKIYKHLYANFQVPLTRTFTIRYRAYSGSTCVNDRIKTIVVNAAPKVQFNNMPNVCLDAAPFQITQASEIGGVPGTGVFTGPGVSLTGIFNPATAGPGVHTIKYTFTSAAGGCIDTLSKTIKVWQPPTADFAFVSPACETKGITFNDNSVAPEGTLTSWRWDFADGSPVLIRNSGAAFTHVFANWGNYAVKLNAITNNGCVSVQKVINVTINPQPKPNFSIPASVCLPNANVTFNNLSSIADGTQSSFSYLWNFGDPGSGAVNNSTGNNPSHTYVATGPFNVNLQVTSGSGCIYDTTIVLNTIHPQPLASFTVNKPFVCIGDNFSFTDNSNSLDGTTTQWNWTMADGNVKNSRTFSYTYTTPGTFPVSLFVFNSQGCRSTTATNPVTVYPYPGVNAGPDKVMLEGGQVALTPALPIGITVTYQWSPATWLNNSTIAYTIASPPDDITYTLKITGDGGCSATDDVFIKVLKAPIIPNIFSPNGDGIHDKWQIGYLESYPGCTVDIFNRYGQLIYHSEGYTQPWDGTVHGQAVPIGTYYYIVDPKNGRKQISGYVDVIR